MIRAIAAAVALAGAAAAQDSAQRWPRAIPLEQGTLVVYSPQLEKLEGVTLSGRAAVSWQARRGAEADGGAEAKGGAPLFGVFWFEARVLVNKEGRTLRVEELDVTKVRFPNATPEQEKRVEQVIEAEVPKWDLTPSLDEVQAAIATSQRARKSEKGITASPPKLLFSNEPAVLLLYDGEPAVRPIPDTGLERAVNTPLFVVRDPSTSRFYLGSTNLWYEAADPKGPWKPVPAPTPKVKAFFDSKPPPPPPPADAEAAPPQQPPTAAQQPLPAPQQPAPEKPATPPKIVVATEPTELIVFDGKPNWVPAGKDAKLLYADNTDANVLLDAAKNQTFVLVSGRWYKAASLKGPWTPVRPDRVPASFRSIPPDSPVGDVRAFVAGTEEAEDAVADTQIPQTTAVKRGQTLEVTYDGEPKFIPVEGTPMAYAVNTSFSVIRDSGKYWACHQGVWYVAPEPRGPFTVSDQRPPSIDQLPPDVPVYNTKYVQVYQSTPAEVYVGYLPGYVGVYPYYGSIVYGTGYWYRPYIGPTFAYAWPATFGVHATWSPWTGFGVGVSWGTPFFSVGVGFGGYGGLYGPVGFRAPVRPVYGYRPPPAGYRGRYGYTAGGTRAPAGAYAAGAARPAGAAQAAAAGQRATASNLYDRPANAARNAPSAQGTARRTPGSSAQPNNVYADRSGNVYRQGQNGSWQKNTPSGWSGTGSAQAGRASGASAAPAGLSSDVSARSRAGGAGRGGGGRGGRR